MDEKEVLQKPLNIETVKELWSKTYNTEGKPDWSHIFPYYHKDIIFQDTIQRICPKRKYHFFRMDNDHDVQKISKYTLVWFNQTDD